MRSRFSQNVKAKAQSAYARITLNRITVAFFVFSFLHCFAQGIIQSFMFSVDSEYGSLFSTITSKAGIPAGNTTFLEGSKGSLHLQMCNDIPHGQSLYPCVDVFKSSTGASGQNTSDNSISVGYIISNFFTQGINVVTQLSGSGNTTEGVNLLSPDGAHKAFLSKTCTQILVFPKQFMTNSRREDLSLIMLQFWLFAISLLAIMDGSVPHILAVLMTRVLVTAWTIYGVWRTEYYQGIFNELVAPGTPCSLDLFTTYFGTRIAYQIPDLILSVTALLIATYLSWTLLQMYTSQSFSRVGAPKHITRINKFLMAVLACLQLEAFVLVAATALWVDILRETAISVISEHTGVYRTAVILTMVALLPWIVMGWYAIRREMKTLMALFLALSFIIIGGWSSMFYSIVYRWTFIQWPYFGCYAVASFVLLIATMVLGIICRLNFDKGLAQYLRAEETLASLNFAPEIFAHDEEKGSIETAEVIEPHQFDQPPPAYYIPTLRSSGQYTATQGASPSRNTKLYSVPYNASF